MSALEQTNDEDNQDVRVEELENIDIDKYGFYSTDKNHRSKILSPVESNRLNKKEAERLEKWEIMLKEWDRTMQSKSEVLKRRVRKGIPHVVRGRVWAKLSQVAIYEVKYHDALERIVELPQCFDEIDRDLDRTFPRHQLFVRRNGSGQESLRNILRGYASIDPEIGYCQGMGFMAAMFLIYMDEASAFYCLISAMQRELSPLRLMYAANFEAVQKIMGVYWKLVRDASKKLWTHLEGQGLHPSMFATEWFLTLFCRSFPFDLVTRVWDIFWLEGFKIVYRVAIALLKFEEKNLLRTNFEGIMKILRELPERLDVIKVLEIAMNLRLKSDRIRELEREYDSVRVVV